MGSVSGLASLPASKETILQSHDHSYGETRPHSRARRLTVSLAQWVLQSQWVLLVVTAHPSLLTCSVCLLFQPALQVLSGHFGRLAKYQQFLESVINKRFKQRYVPLTLAGSAKEGRRLALAPEFYDQVSDETVRHALVGCCSTVPVFTWFKARASCTSRAC
jgi:hypothetical protein